VGAVEGGGGPVEGVEEVGYDDEDAGDAADALLRKLVKSDKRKGREVRRPIECRALGRRRRVSLQHWILVSSWS